MRSNWLLKQRKATLYSSASRCITLRVIAASLLATLRVAALIGLRVLRTLILFGLRAVKQSIASRCVVAAQQQRLLRKRPLQHRCNGAVQELRSCTGFARAKKLASQACIASRCSAMQALRRFERVRARGRPSACACFAGGLRPSQKEFTCANTDLNSFLRGLNTTQLLQKPKIGALFDQFPKTKTKMIIKEGNMGPKTPPAVAN